MYVCMYVCMYVSIYLSMYESMYIRIYTYIHSTDTTPMPPKKRLLFCHVSNLFQQLLMGASAAARQPLCSWKES